MSHSSSVQSDLTLLRSFNAATYKTPFLVINLETLINSYRHLDNCLKHFKLYYAVKANPELGVLKALAKLGSCFEIASVNELQCLLDIGISPKKIIYSNPVKLWQHIEQAFQAGVESFAFDSVGELEKLSKYAPGSSLYLRFIVNDQGSTFPLSKKFGAEPQDIVPLMSMAKDLGFKPSGLTFHVGSQSLHPRMWESAIKLAGDAMEDLLRYDIRLDILNIGGGFPAYYGEEVPSFESIGEVLQDAIKKYLPYKVELLAEPGRALVAEAGTLVTSVIGRAERGGKTWLYLDVSAFNGLMETLETSNTFNYPLQLARHSLRHKTTPYTLTGPTCDPQDTMFYDIALPDDIMVSDKIYISSAGAYTTVYASPFNSFALPKVYYTNE